METTATAPELLEQLGLLPGSIGMSDTDPRDLAAPQQSTIRDFLNDNLFAFAYAIFGYEGLLEPDVHLPLCKLVEKWGDPGYRRLMIQVPRDIGKTSIVTRANSLRIICRNPDETVAIFNEKEDNSRNWVRAIKEVVTGSQLFKTIYADLLPRGVVDGMNPPKGWPWNDAALLFQRGLAGIPEKSIMALGVTAATTGGHWTRIVKDDILSFEASRSSSVMAMIRDWIDASRNLERPAQKGCDLFVCTPWAFGDAYAYLLDKYGDEYQLYRRSALEKGESIHPRKWTTKELVKMQTTDPYNFAAQYQCVPMAGRDQSFQRDWLRYGYVDRDDMFHIRKEHYSVDCHVVGAEGEPPQHVPLHQMEKVLLVDPAPSEEADRNRNPKARNALVTTGIDAWGRIYILDVWTGRPDPGEVVNKMLDLAENWEFTRVAIEKVVFSVLYKHWLQQEAQRRNVYIGCTDLEPGKRSKDARIEAMIPGFKEGLYYFNDANPGVQALIQEYAEYPHGQTRDILDALAYAPDVLRRPETPEEMQDRLVNEQRPGWPYSTRDPVTGY